MHLCVFPSNYYPFPPLPQVLNLDYFFLTKTITLSIIIIIIIIIIFNLWGCFKWFYIMICLVIVKYVEV